MIKVSKNVANTDCGLEGKVAHKYTLFDAILQGREAKAEEKPVPITTSRMNWRRRSFLSCRADFSLFFRGKWHTWSHPYWRGMMRKSGWAASQP